MFRRAIKSEYLVFFLCVFYFAALVPFTPEFASSGNLTNIFSAMLPLLVVATGQTLVLITAGIDLSVTSTIALTSVLGAMIMSGDGGLLAGHALAAPVGIVVMLVVGALIGAINGSLIAGCRMPPFIATLTTMMFFSGFAIWLTQSKPIHDLPPQFLLLGKNLSVTAAIVILVAAIAQFVLTRTLLGRWVYAIGHNSRVAVISGTPVLKVTILVYVLCGITAAIGAILITGRLETGSPVHWRDNLLDVVGATVIGGTSLYGGKGKVMWTVFGVLFLTLIDNSLNLLNLSHFTIMIVKGGVILFAAMLDAIRNKLLTS